MRSTPAPSVVEMLPGETEKVMALPLLRMAMEPLRPEGSRPSSSEPSLRMAPPKRRKEPSVTTSLPPCSMVKPPEGA